MQSVKFLNQVKAKYGLKNDRQLAEHLGVTSGTISQYMNGKRVMDDEACLAVALQLDINPLEIIGAACIDRAEKTGQKSLWEVFMSRTAMTAGTVLVASGVNLFLTTPPANAATMRVPTTSDSNFYRLCEISQMPLRIT
ncbi:helix-turn-helix domain-containing protein [Massilia sp. CT11-108]|uniref:helix-turn-helix domain-containing protein n=1 Tax=Massilia sp. CT11-108 TaxID=3393900 RepID=UPI0039A415F5